MFCPHRCLSQLGQRSADAAYRTSLSDADEPRSRSWSRSRTLSVSGNQGGSVSLFIFLIFFFFNQIILYFDDLISCQKYVGLLGCPFACAVSVCLVLDYCECLWLLIYYYYFMPPYICILLSHVTFNKWSFCSQVGMAGDHLHCFQKR